MNNKKTHLPALLITILLLLCLLTAGSVFALPAIEGRILAQAPAKARNTGAGEEESLGAWLGLDSVRSILLPEDPARSAAKTASLQKEADPAAAAASEKEKPAQASTDISAKEKTNAGAATPSSKEKPAQASTGASAKETAASAKKKSLTDDSPANNAKEKGTEEKETPQASMTRLQKKYVRAWEDYHGRAFFVNAPLHNYNWKYLRCDETGRLHYDGDKRYSIRHGIDVSEFQGRIDWEKVRASGIDFVFVRAGHRMFESGGLMRDTRAVKNLIRAKKAGLEVGVYVFSQAVTEAEAREEAALCLEVIKESGVEITLPVVFDPEIQIEYDARINLIDGEQFTDNTLAFCKAIKKAGYAPAVYANCSTQTDILDMARLDGQALVWYADYNSIPESPYQFTFWQYSNTGRVDGIPEAETDLNVWFVENR